MNRMKKLFGTTLFAAALLASALFTACNDDDDAAALTAADLTGTYAGTFDFTPSPSDLNPEPAPETGVAVELKVEHGKVVFPELPDWFPCSAPSPTKRRSTRRQPMRMRWSQRSTRRSCASTSVPGCSSSSSPSSRRTSSATRRRER